MKIDRKRYAPMGIDPDVEMKYILIGLGFACLWAIINFAGQYRDALAMLYYNSHSQFRILIPGAVMTDFQDLLLGGEVLFSLVCLAMPFLAAYHYWFHRQGAMTVYLMRRLPDRWEYHRRCLTIPVVGIVAALALLGFLSIIFYLVYRLCTPAQCLPM